MPTYSFLDIALPEHFIPSLTDLGNNDAEAVMVEVMVEVLVVVESGLPHGLQVWSRPEACVGNLVLDLYGIGGEVAEALVRCAGSLISDKVDNQEWNEAEDSAGVRVVIDGI